MAGDTPARNAFLFGLAARIQAAAAAFAAAALAERERWPLWLPVAIGAGIGLYFALPVEPGPLAGALPVPAALAGLVLAWRRHRLGPILAAALALALTLGFAAAALRTAWVAAPVLERSGATWLTARVVEIERLPDQGRRVTFDRVALDRDDLGPTPARIRLRLRPGGPAIAVGDRLRLRALLNPPAAPALPGGFDFARFCWFKQWGATGTALSPPEPIDAAAAPGSLTVAVNALRQSITARIVAVLPGDRGAVTAALITGDQMPISAPLMQAYRDSGLAHILSISGLHISLAAGLVFVGLRTLLALIPPLALRHPIKKWAAALAIASAWGYTLLAGSPVPAERSLLMIVLVLAAVLLDRAVLSMRPVALAATLLLLLQPEELTGASFQMSFAAVVALIALAEAWAPHQAAWRAAHPGPLAGAGLYLVVISLTTLTAGMITAAYAIYHFNRFALWAVAANLVAIPLTGFWVMPWALLLALLLPFGLETVALVPMGWGVDLVNRVALAVAAWPEAAIATPPLPLAGLVVFTLGGCWLCLWRGRWRRWGLAAMAGGLLTMALPAPPDLLVDGHGAAFALRAADGGLLLNGKGGGMLRDTWSRRAGPPTDEPWPEDGLSRDGRLSCAPAGCRWRPGDGRTVALILDESDIAAACAEAAVVVSRVPLRHACPGPATVIDRFDLWRGGTHALWLRPGGVEVLSVAANQGDRPWRRQPARRRRNP
ncbi:MAG: hypothetical protein RLZZ501_1422 [Pseudomonadota bacterium]|jgi:competence protein ComEC